MDATHDNGELPKYRRYQGYESLQVAGYRPQSREAVETVNAVKEMEEHVLRLLDEIADDLMLAADKRWLATGRTDIEQGFMAVNRAVFKPERVAIADLDEPIVEVAWVLEREDSEPAEPLYYAPDGPHGGMWSMDHDQALRFDREIDASRQAMAMGVKVRVCEHQWG